ncbi:UNVERIFIED_CONTAM: hypothetical protein Slati_2159300 [Sesamum latifolium]|uniref:Uncharacterized protein n=1 Tax=Sesamum latifolium TaxID=2727402 RepID=A0AAW2WSX6_9LAMI
MVSGRFEDSSMGGASDEIVVLGGSAGGSVDLGGTDVVDQEMGVRELFEKTCRAWVVTTGVSPAFCLPGALGVFKVSSRLKLCDSHRQHQLMRPETHRSNRLF